MTKCIICYFYIADGFEVYISRMCLANKVSDDSLAISKRMYIRSKRDKRGGDRLMFYINDFWGLNLESIGLAATKTDVREFNWQTIPALAIDIVCCSIASSKIVLAFSSTLSN
jgi:hypothetical protein